MRKLTEAFKTIHGLFGDNAHDRRFADGREQVDSTPMSLPVGISRPLTLQEQVARLVRSESVRAEAERMGKESFDDADDFEHDDDDPLSPYEKDFDIATVQAANRGFIEEQPLPRSRIDEVRSKYLKKKDKKKEPSSSAKEGESGDEPLEQ